MSETTTGGAAAQPGQQQQAGTTGPQRPDGISETEWSALGDPGRTAIVRERAARQDADRRANDLQRSLQQATAHQTQQQTHQAQHTQQQPGQQQEQTQQQPGQQPGPQDLQQMIAAAVQAAFQPFTQQQQQAAADRAATQLREAVTTAAQERFHDAGDALGHLKLAELTDASGAADPAKVTAALDKLLETKPYLGKPVDPRRRAAAGSLVGAGGATSSGTVEERASATLARMQRSAGVKFAGQAGS